MRVLVTHMLGQLQRAYLRNGRVLWVRALHLSLQLNHGPFQHRTVRAAYGQQHSVLACAHGVPCVLGEQVHLSTQLEFLFLLWSPKSAFPARVAH